MKILAWDTSSKSGTLVAMERAGGLDASGFRLIAEMTLNVDATHSEKLLLGIHTTLEAAHWKIGDVDLLGVGVGPGSFTGLRIGVTTARTLAHTLGKPLVGVSSLAVLARPASLQVSDEMKSKTWIIAVTDACKGEVFALWGKASDVACCVLPPRLGASHSLWKEGVEEVVISPDLLMEKIKKKRMIVVGDALARYLDKDSAAVQATMQGRYLGSLVCEAYLAGMSQEGLKTVPHYLRASEAERKLKAGLLPPAVIKRT